MAIEPRQHPRAHGPSATRTHATVTDDLRIPAAPDGPVGAPDGAQPEGILRDPRTGGALRRYRTVAIGLALTDALCVVVALLASYEVRYSNRPMPLAELAIVVVAPLLWVGVFRAFNLYAPQHLAPPEQFRRVIGATSLGIVLVVMASYWSKSSFPRSWVGLGWLLALLFELLTRALWDWYQGRLKRQGRLAFRTLIVGTTAEATRLAEILKAPASGFTPLGYVHASVQAAPMNSLPLIGDVAELRQLVRGYGADCLFVASSSVNDQDMAWIGQVARQEGTEVRVSANLTQTLTSRLTLQKVGGAIALSFRPVRLTGAQVAMKRAFDLVSASVAVLISFPLWAGIALCVRLTSRGPVLFHQERVSKGGRVFRMHKFRTMRTDFDIPLDTTTPFFKLESDPRLTRVGRLIRRLSLDELPQLWNVLKGEMSLVGPRPLPADQVAANLELLSPRHEVPAGVTGWWQINGRSSVTPEEAIHLDQFYIENWSLSLDLYILLKTFGAVLGQKGAH
jgi:exopolysaccharide biosynthesis polyprenyl glycosylphosphotransferase